MRDLHHGNPASNFSIFPAGYRLSNGGVYGHA